jgi:hypothetical protein
VRRRALLLAAAIALTACGGSHLPLPATGPHTGDKPVLVTTLPPPGKVEIVGKPDEKLKSPVWLDGEWDWTGRRWEWKEGRWEEPMPDGYYAPPRTVRDKDGSLAYYKGVWKKGKPRK